MKARTSLVLLAFFATLMFTMIFVGIQIAKAATITVDDRGGKKRDNSSSSPVIFVEIDCIALRLSSEFNRTTILIKSYKHTDIHEQRLSYQLDL